MFLLIGETLSLFGDTALYLALAIWVKTLTGSSAAAGLVFSSLALPSLVAPFAGLIVDRMRRSLMIATDLALLAPWCCSCFWSTVVTRSG